MAKKDSVNVQIFTALKVGEKAREVPVLLMSNPGMGKSTTVAQFARHRGYHLQLLKGNSTSAEEIMGYDVVPTGDMIVKDKQSTVHLRPSWFSNILAKEDEGIPTLLFLDEITTAPEHVQSALLTLIFDRRVGDEFLPESTLVVSAGNYVQNLSNQMNLIPPLMNRFLIYNVTANSSDLDSFLCKYKGALSDDDGKVHDHMDDLLQIIQEMDKNELAVDEGTSNKIGEYIERSVKETARGLMDGGERNLSFDVTDLQSIYGDTIDDSFLYGFATLRTLHYLVEITKASYLCFGKPGLVSDSYSKMIDGLVGYGISRDKKTREVKKTRLTQEFLDSMRTVANDIDKMNNSSIPKYEKFLKEVLGKSDSKSGWDIPELKTIQEKFDEIQGDKTIKSVERPINPDMMVEILKTISQSALSNEAKHLKVNKAVSPSEWMKTIPIEKISGMMNKWNYTAKAFAAVEKFVTSDGYKYGSDVMDSFKKSVNDCKSIQFRITTLRKILSKNIEGYEKIIPDAITVNSLNNKVAGE